MELQAQKDLFRFSCVRAFMVSTLAFLVGYMVDLFVNIHMDTDPGMLDSFSIAAFCGCAAWIVTMPLVYLRKKRHAERLEAMMPRRRL